MSALSYWIESTTGKTYLKVPELLPFETRMYEVKKTPGYVPDIDDVMEFGDEFTTFDTSKWEIPTGAGTPVVSNGVLSLPTGKDGLRIVNKTILDDGYIITSRLKHSGYNNDRAWFGINVRDQALFSYNYSRGYFLAYYQSANDAQRGTRLWRSSGSGISSIDGDMVIGALHNTYYVKSIIVNDGYIRSVDNPNIDVLDNTYPSGKIGISGNAFGTVQVDYIYVRKYASVEPTVVVEDMGTWYKVSITNNVGETLTDYQVAIPSNELGISSVDDSLQILPIHRSEITNVPYNDLFTDCIAYWDFMGDAQAVIGTNATVTGATLTTDRFGIQNAAYSHNGSSSSITCPVKVITSVEFTVETLIFVPSGQSTGKLAYLFGQNNIGWTGHGIEFNIETHTGNKINCSWCIGDGTNPGGASYTMLVSDYDRWLHVVATRDSAGQIKIYVDAADVATSTANQTSTTSTLSSTYLGGTYVNNEGTYRMAHTSAYTRAWSRKLSPMEIQILHKLSQTGYIYPIMHPRRLLL